MKTEHTPQWDANDAAELIFREIAAMNGIRTLRDKAEAWIELNQKYKAERARLIAAAPEMLEALKRIAECCEAEPDSTCYACGKLAAEIIAKAEEV